MRIRDYTELCNTAKADVNFTPYIEIGDIDIETKEYVIKEKKAVSGSVISSFGEILVSTVRPTRGAITVVKEEKAAVSSAFAIIRPDSNKCEPRYLFYCLNSKPFLDYLGKNSKGATYPTCAKEDVFNYPIKARTKYEQTTIVKKLDVLTSIIRNRKTEIRALDHLTKARFIEMFGDPRTNPKGWKKEPLKEHATVLVGYPFPSEEYSYEGIDIVGGYNLMHGYIQWDESKHWHDSAGYEKYLLRANDIVMAMDRPWVNGGFKIAKVDAARLPALLIQRTACIRGNSVVQDFLFALLDAPQFAEHCNITGSLVPHISNKDINSFPIILPPLDLQKEYARFVRQVDSTKTVVQKSLDKAQVLFDSLMQEYFG